MSKDIVIAVDVMGGDHGPAVVVPGAVAAARESGISLALVGDEAKVYTELEKLNCSDVPVHVVHAAQVAEMHDKPSEVLRRKKDASIQVACQLVREGSAHGLVSPGHSGATVACGMFVVGRVEGVDRPALASFLPTENDPMVLLDVGATVDCKPHNLFQFGLMGDAVAKALLNIEKPSVGLLSIGEEEGKGNTQVKEAYELFKMAQNINFLGNAEGRDIFTGQVDIVVCDGFVGNVFLKGTEGLAQMIGSFLREEFSRGWFSKLLALCAMPVLKRFKQRVDHRRYNGAALVGLRGVVIKSHGSADAYAFEQAIHRAADAAANNLVQRITERMAAATQETAV